MKNSYKKYNISLSSVMKKCNEINDLIKEATNSVGILEEFALSLEKKLEKIKNK